VFNELGEVVGIAFQSYAGSDAENIGYVIPTPVIHHFLDDYRRNGAFTGFPALGVQWQRMESTALRQHFKMGDGQKGVLVRSVQPISHAHGQLFPGDVLLAFDGVEVASGGWLACRLAV
jgi:S1-C subfamily serine protease